MTINRYPVLPLRDIVVFPNMIVPLFVGRQGSIRALEAAVEEDQRQKVLLVTQKSDSKEKSLSDDLYNTGTVGSILQILKLPDGTMKVLVEGLQRAKIVELHTDENDDSVYIEADAEIIESKAMPDDIPQEHAKSPQEEALMRAVVKHFDQYVKLNKRIPPEVLSAMEQLTDADRLADTVAAHISIKIAEKQQILETLNTKQRLQKVFEAIEGEISILKTEKKLRIQVKDQVEKSQRDYYLNEQMKAIQKELGDDIPNLKKEIDKYNKQVKAKNLSKEAEEKAEEEIKKLRSMSPMSGEAAIIRTYLDTMLSLPWNENQDVEHDIHRSEEILEDRHYGLDKVKERVLEYLAVQERQRERAKETGEKYNSPILCLVGPPGVGKTSLGKAIAKAAGRHFVRMSLGGVRDETEIRGHRRTYLGALPGKILQGMKKAKSSNPLFLLDEIDKMGHDHRGDPASALLEVLDPEQNNAFNDHYLEVDYDLSQVMFICTANSMEMPRPLLDRMEIIRLSGYTEEEKMEISRRHLLKRQSKEHGLELKEWPISDDVVRDIIRYYTKEAGVRGLERQIAKLARKATRQLVADASIDAVEINPENLTDYLGVRQYKYGVAEEENLVGVVTGLAWTEVGGELLTIEALKLPGKGNIKTTGKLGEVMEESIQAASSYVRSKSPEFGIKSDFFEKMDIHVHVPEGATPKDGPSAGIAMVTSIISVLTGIPVRKDIAMTGETTLRGRVLPIGGLKEKLLAAKRGGIKTVLIPEDNVKDLAEIPDIIKNALEIIPVKNVYQVLSQALTEKPIAIEDDFMNLPPKGALLTSEPPTASVH